MFPVQRDSLYWKRVTDYQNFEHIYGVFKIVVSS